MPQHVDIQFRVFGINRQRQWNELWKPIFHNLFYYAPYFTEAKFGTYAQELNLHAMHNLIRQGWHESQLAIVMIFR